MLGRIKTLLFHVMPANLMHVDNTGTFKCDAACQPLKLHTGTCYFYQLPLHFLCLNIPRKPNGLFTCTSTLDSVHRLANAAAHKSHTPSIRPTAWEQIKNFF